MLKNMDAGAITIIRALGREAHSRAEIASATGMSRNTVATRLEALGANHWVIEHEDGQGQRGRPFTRYRVNPHAAYIYVANFGWDHLSAAICTLDGEIVETQIVSVEFGPGHQEAVIDIVASAFAQLLETSQLPRERVAVTVVGIPNPVANPNLIQDWAHGTVAASEFRDRLRMPVCIENDVNLMATGAGRDYPDARSLLFVKVGTYIGAGLIVAGRLHSGLGGLAGEIGHIPVSRGAGRVCMCGNRGCLAVTAGLAAIIDSVSTQERPIHNLTELRSLVAAGDGDAVIALRQAGRDIGEALVGLAVGMAPDVIVLGGGVTQVGDNLLIGIRESLDRLSLPALSSRLRIVTSPNHRLDGLRGAADLAFERIFAA